MRDRPEVGEWSRFAYLSVLLHLLRVLPARLRLLNGLCNRASEEVGTSTPELLAGGSAACLNTHLLVFLATDGDQQHRLRLRSRRNE